MRVFTITQGLSIGLANFQPGDTALIIEIIENSRVVMRRNLKASCGVKFSLR